MNQPFLTDELPAVPCVFRASPDDFEVEEIIKRPLLKYPRL